MRYLSVLAALGLCMVITGCGFFQARVEKWDKKIDVVEARLLLASVEERPALEVKLEELKEERRVYTEGAQTEASNKQAFLMALLGIGGKIGEMLIVGSRKAVAG